MASHDAILGDWCWFVMDLVRMRQEVCILAALLTSSIITSPDLIREAAQRLIRPSDCKASPPA